MKEIFLYKKYLSEIGSSITKPIAWVLAWMVTLSTEQNAIILLLGVILCDYATGVLASYLEFKKLHPNESFFRSQQPNEENKERYSSEKNKLSFVKFVTYFSVILITYGVQHVFKIKGIETEYSAHKNISITLISIGFCIGNEFYSIVWENLPRAGYDFPKKVMKVIDVIKSSIKKIKE